MNTRTKNEIIQLAKDNSTEEICGFICVNEGKSIVYPCKNVSRENLGENFTIDPQDYIEATHVGRIVGIYHSHPTGAASFSEADLSLAEEMELPLFLYAVETNEWTSFVPKNYELPLSGLPFNWGNFDCYELIRIYFRQIHGIYLTDYDRDETFENAEKSAITQYIEKEGFYWVPGNGPIKEHDVLLFKTPGTAYPHHLGVFLGKQRALHHPLGALSRIDTLNEKWLKRLAGVLRCAKIT